MQNTQAESTFSGTLSMRKPRKAFWAVLSIGYHAITKFPFFIWTSFHKNNISKCLHIPLCAQFNYVKYGYLLIQTHNWETKFLQRGSMAYFRQEHYFNDETLLQGFHNCCNMFQLCGILQFLYYLAWAKLWIVKYCLIGRNSNIPGGRFYRSQKTTDCQTNAIFIPYFNLIKTSQ